MLGGGLSRPLRIISFPREGRGPVLAMGKGVAVVSVLLELRVLHGPGQEVRRRQLHVCGGPARGEGPSRRAQKAEALTVPLFKEEREEEVLFETWLMESCFFFFGPIFFLGRNVASKPFSFILFLLRGGG